MTDSVQSTFTGEDGENVAIIDWSLPDGQRPLAVVLISHGLGEHIWRYQHVAQQLNAWGYAVRGYDQYGHGDSGGPRGALPHMNRMLADMADVVDDTNRLYGQHTPIVILGHSMGGLVAADFVAKGMRTVAALVLSSPALNAGLNPFQKLLVATLPHIAPNLRVDNGLNANFVSRDPAVVKAYTSDKLVHRLISTSLARYIAITGPKVIAAAPSWVTPTLLMFAGQDKLINPQGSRDFAKAAPRALLTAQCFEPMFHEIFNDPEREQVFTALRNWLDGRFLTR